AVMEGESAVQAVHGPALARAKAAGGELPADVSAAVDSMREDYERQLDARHAGARGFIDAIVYPEDTRVALAMALRAALQNPGPHLGPFQLSGSPELDGGMDSGRLTRPAASQGGSE